MIEGIIQANPKSSIIVFAGIMSLFITIVNYFVLDKDKVKASKKKQKELRLLMKDLKDSPVKMMELQKEQMSLAMTNMKHSFKPMLITMIPILVFFWWIKELYVNTTLGGSWFWYYLVSAIFFSIVFRKIFKLP
jgi:uncharacterized membrane protein (DUF106 family)|tara:strand:- start:45 stop:446 length:402 start_codon:yes stop_codon:yes gene_type:complete